MYDESDFSLTKRVRVMQIITLALLTGVISCAAVALSLVTNREPPAEPPTPIISYVALAMLFANTCLSVLMPAFMVAAGMARLGAMPSSGDRTKDRQLAGEHLLNLQQTGLIVALALIEGAAFLGCVAFMVEGWWPVLGQVAAGVLLILMHFPTTAAVGGRLEKNLARVEEVRDTIARDGNS